MRIAFITAGAAGMYCGSCMRDNTLISALIRNGHDSVLIPTYTPIRTDEVNFSQGRVFYGGINVYLEQKSWLFRHTPRFVDWLLNRPMLIRWATKAAATADYAMLGDLTVSMLQGQDGKQKKELKLLVDYLRSEIKPDVVLLTNAMLSAVAKAVQQSLGVPVLTTLQGDDIFLDELPAGLRKKSIELIQANDHYTTGYIATSRYYAEHMSQYFGIDIQKVHQVYPGISLTGHGRPELYAPRERPVIGYFARISPEKGLANLVDAYIRYRQQPDSLPARLHVSGWLGKHHQSYLNEQLAKLAGAGLKDDFLHVDAPGHADKVRFLHGIDLLSVPTNYREPKALYVLEAWANGVPVVLPRHGAFTELIEQTGGGLLVEPGDPVALAEGLGRMLADPKLRSDCGRKGMDAVRERFSDQIMAEQTVELLNNIVRPKPSSATVTPAGSRV